ncbi:DNA polymerase delta subunit 3 [Gouania willdenowi]|uniref:DNA polymerase delta subunit 3 n=1 Tax=Gouania willdenowi TaxID=441366 RepID=A0A8C5I8R6_GOUWI|nr:DNA polymerase delta subunit 3 [Gouania willdenowi]
MDELYLDNIDEYVNDHNKIVTYKWLSLTLGVHVNTAKQMLFHYLDHKRKESSAQLHATYLVSGKFVNNGQTCHKVSVIREEQLEDVKAKMSLIASVHVYSIQKALLKDSGPLYGVDYDAVRDNLKNCSRFSAIRCSSAVPMSSQELQQVKEIQRPPTSEPETKKSVSNIQTAVASKAIKPQKGIMGMFSNKTASKTQNSTKEIKTEEKDSPMVEAPKSKPALKPNSLMSMFENQTAKKTDKTVKEEAPPAAKAAPAAKPAAVQSSTSTSQPQNKLSHKEEKEEATVAKPQKESKSKSKRIQDSDSEEEKMEKKKRRRIKKPEPDSSDEEVIPDSPQKKETKEPSPSPEKQLESVTHSHQENPDKRVRKRRRVLKSKTFVDEEGCIVTEKAYESESYSESEEDFKAPKQAARDPFKGKLHSNGKDEKKSRQKASANTNKSTKQASITGFFQKK